LASSAPVGIGVADAWANILAGRSGIGRITRFDVSTFPSQIAGEVKGFDVTKYLSGKEARRYDTFIHYGTRRHDGGGEGRRTRRLHGRQGACGCLHRLGHRRPADDRETHSNYLQGGLRKVSPFFVPGSIINMIAGLVSIHYGYQGPNLGTVSACSTANHSIGEAARLIEYGDADIMLAAGPRGPCPARDRRLLRIARAFDTQRRSRTREPSLGRGPRRLRAGRGCGRARPRGARARPGARGAHLLRALPATA
jgi:3-oxoacyl-[acyl-carrier-protein] synthase II